MILGLQVTKARIDEVAHEVFHGDASVPFAHTADDMNHIFFGIERVIEVAEQILIHRSHGIGPELLKLIIAQVALAEADARILPSRRAPNYGRKAVVLTASGFASISRSIDKAKEMDGATVAN